MVGQVTKYTTLNGFTENNPNMNYDDVSPYNNFEGDYASDFDGDSVSDSEFAGENDLMDFSNASGRRRKKKKGSTMKSRMATRQKARADRKDRKLKIKEQQSETQKKVAEDLGKEDPATLKLMESLATDDTKKADAPKGMSKGLKIGLIVGGVVIAGIVTILVIKKMKAKKSGK
jgi:hypothetical protein